MSILTKATMEATGVFYDWASRTVFSGLGVNEGVSGDDHAVGGIDDGDHPAVSPGAPGGGSSKSMPGVASIEEEGGDDNSIETNYSAGGKEELHEASPGPNSSLSKPTAASVGSSDDNSIETNYSVGAGGPNGVSSHPGEALPDVKGHEGEDSDENSIETNYSGGGDEGNNASAFTSPCEDVSPNPVADSLEANRCVGGGSDENSIETNYSAGGKDAPVSLCEPGEVLPKDVPPEEDVSDDNSIETNYSAGGKEDTDARLSPLTQRIMEMDSAGKPTSFHDWAADTVFENLEPTKRDSSEVTDKNQERHVVTPTSGGSVDRNASSEGGMMVAKSTVEISSADENCAPADEAKGTVLSTKEIFKKNLMQAAAAAQAQAKTLASDVKDEIRQTSMQVTQTDEVDVVGKNEPEGQVASNCPTDPALPRKGKGQSGPAQRIASFTDWASDAIFDGLPDNSVTEADIKADSNVRKLPPGPNKIEQARGHEDDSCEVASPEKSATLHSEKAQEPGEEVPVANGDDKLDNPSTPLEEKLLQAESESQDVPVDGNDIPVEEEIVGSIEFRKWAADAVFSGLADPKAENVGSDGPKTTERLEASKSTERLEASESSMEPPNVLAQPDASEPIEQSPVSDQPVRPVGSREKGALSVSFRNQSSVVANKPQLSNLGISTASENEASLVLETLIEDDKGSATQIPPQEEGGEKVEHEVDVVSSSKERVNKSMDTETVLSSSIADADFAEPPPLARPAEVVSPDIPKAAKEEHPHDRPSHPPRLPEETETNTNAEEAKSSNPGSATGETTATTGGGAVDSARPNRRLVKSIIRKHRSKRNLNLSKSTSRRELQEKLEKTKSLSALGGGISQQTADFRLLSLDAPPLRSSIIERTALPERRWSSDVVADKKHNKSYFKVNDQYQLDSAGDQRQSDREAGEKWKLEKSKSHSGRGGSELRSSGYKDQWDPDEFSDDSVDVDSKPFEIESFGVIRQNSNRSGHQEMNFARFHKVNDDPNVQKLEKSKEKSKGKSHSGRGGNELRSSGYRHSFEFNDNSDESEGKRPSGHAIKGNSKATVPSNTHPKEHPKQQSSDTKINSRRKGGCIDEPNKLSIEPKIKPLSGQMAVEQRKPDIPESKHQQKEQELIEGSVNDKSKHSNGHAESRQKADIPQSISRSSSHKKVPSLFTIPTIVTASVTKQSPEERVGLVFTERRNRIILAKMMDTSPFQPTNLQIDDELLIINGHRIKNAKKSAEFIKASRGILTLRAFRGRRPRESELEMMRLSDLDCNDIQLCSNNKMVYIIKTSGRFSKSGKIRVGDIILSINGVPVSSAEKARELLLEGSMQDNQSPNAYNRLKSEYDADQTPTQSRLVVMLVFNLAKLRARLISKISKQLPVVWNADYNECTIELPSGDAQKILYIHSDGNCEDMSPSPEEIDPRLRKEIQRFASLFYCLFQDAMRELRVSIQHHAKYI